MSDLAYLRTSDGFTPADLDLDDLVGFFKGWPNAPSAQQHRRLLSSSDYAVVARDGRHGPVVGFATAIADGVLAAYIPLLEVLPSHRGHGIGSALIEHLLADLADYYMVDLVCDPDLADFYKPLGFQPAHAMITRRYHHQSGITP